MAAFRPTLLEASNSSARMDALCAFIEFWLDPRQPSFGETPEALSRRSLPMPLRRLYEFAGRWPDSDEDRSIGDALFVIPALSNQDSLVACQNLESEDGKLVFIHENQGVWNCRTLANGDDPSAWCSDQMDKNYNWVKKEKLICDSLSCFLVTFVLRELTYGSRFCLRDEGLKARFVSELDSAAPVWTNGPYVYGSVHNFYLWRDVLVQRRDDIYFAANRDEGIDFLTENLGPVNADRPDNSTAMES